MAFRVGAALEADEAHALRAGPFGLHRSDGLGETGADVWQLGFIMEETKQYSYMKQPLFLRCLLFDAKLLVLTYAFLEKSHWT